AQVLALGEADDGGRVLDLYRWGLIPSWMRHGAGLPQMHNARAESVATKPAFRGAFIHRRVAVLAEGYYEWRRMPGAKPQPFYIHRTDGAPLAFAGLWESSMGDGHRVRSTAIITTAAGPDTEAVHDRMPVILDDDLLDLWLDRREEDREILEPLLGPSPRGTVVARPVDPRVGRVAEDDPGLIAEVTPDPDWEIVQPLTLF
ncbi:MAG TPA: SOS response-associated peptidase, partial [Acidimicrobiales bacterium]|nr:SOS response-associated peptidase [Acidimicrobiales bacterium]